MSCRYLPAVVENMSIDCQSDVGMSQRSSRLIAGGVGSARRLRAFIFVVLAAHGVSSCGENVRKSGEIRERVITGLAGVRESQQGIENLDHGPLTFEKGPWLGDRAVLTRRGRALPADLAKKEIRLEFEASHGDNVVTASDVAAGIAKQLGVPVVEDLSYLSLLEAPRPAAPARKSQDTSSSTDSFSSSGSSTGSSSGWSDSGSSWSSGSAPGDPSTSQAGTGSSWSSSSQDDPSTITVDAGSVSTRSTQKAEDDRESRERRKTLLFQTSQLSPFDRRGWLASQKLRSAFRYSGSAEGVLDQVVSTFGLAGWEHRDGTVQLIVADTRRYTLDLLFNDQTKGFWEEIENGIRRVCGVCTVSRSENFTGFDVTALPDAGPRIRSYMQERNEYISNLIQVEFDLYEVIWDASDGYNFDLDIVFKNSKMALAFGGAETVLRSASETDDAPSFEDTTDTDSQAKLTLSQGKGAGSFVFLKPDSRFSGSGAVFDALSRSSQGVIVRSQTLVIPNNRSMDFKVSDISQVVVGTNQTDRHHESGLTVTREEQLESFETGTVLKLHPMVTRDGLILLGYEITINALVYPTLAGAVIEDSVIRSHRREHRVSGEVRVPSGVRLVFNQTTNTSASSTADGVGTSSFFLLGGGRSTNSQRTTTLISLRPSRIHTRRLSPDRSRDPTGFHRDRQ